MRAGLGPEDRELLLRLLRLPTAGPLETGPGGPRPRLREALAEYARAAGAIGFRTVHHGCAEPAELDRDDVPAPVREALGTPGFLADQPSLVLRLGPALPKARTVMFNVHLDTVAGEQPAGFDGARFRGRGAIDAKGPAVALLAGVRAARALRPAIGRDVAVLVQAVAGEEGGAMGVLGTRPLVERGFTGRLNVFCEPTRLRFLPRSTAAMTARVVVDGDGAVDDRPGTGHNASVLLGFLAQHLGRALDPHAAAGAVCLAGLHTGTLHNRVYGTGSLLLNLSYASAAAGRALERAVREALDDGLAAFTAAFGGTALFGRTAAEARAVTRLEWRKRGLPVLDDRDPWGHALLRSAGIEPWPPGEPAFTCDAIWMAGVADACAVVLGPGDLAANRAHADGEYARADELDAFAAGAARLLTAFTDDVNGGP
ncbi:M20/M25/M40 family metallo-hydrolase [Allonocardiopsis opalescens]|uniref:Acetylornithine deacetylase/succinyl-diaminopimelate desuccinylase-like protein n=1 Tax=Allonocardiopsis opalescens TaxID=1144618 RepID=A0A2T0QEL9_9ACTN|nr:M20/M25/M40 family metallo-hydrolase [Allonocardiopsis opalescens]PRY02377.1 acetylornithine deacetylase/succinyl-diaminopimelate desuccinylase-like protein [Allonocardiopsis opalescens]